MHFFEETTAMKNYPVLKTLLMALTVFGFCQSSQASVPFQSHWLGSRVWIGPEYWANPLQDWRMDEGQVVALAAHDRTLHQLTHQVTETMGDFEMEVQLRLDGAVTGKFSQSFVNPAGPTHLKIRKCAGINNYTAVVNTRLPVNS